MGGSGSTRGREPFERPTKHMLTHGTKVVPTLSELVEIILHCLMCGNSGQIPITRSSFAISSFCSRRAYVMHATFGINLRVCVSTLKLSSKAIQIQMTSCWSKSPLLPVTFTTQCSYRRVETRIEHLKWTRQCIFTRLSSSLFQHYACTLLLFTFYNNIAFFSYFIGKAMAQARARPWPGA